MMILLLLLIQNIIFKEYLLEKIFTRIDLPEKCKYTTQYFWKINKYIFFYNINYLEMLLIIKIEWNHSNKTQKIKKT